MTDTWRASPNASKPSSYPLLLLLRWSHCSATWQKSGGSETLLSAVLFHSENAPALTHLGDELRRLRKGDALCSSCSVRQRPDDTYLQAVFWPENEPVFGSPELFHRFQWPWNFCYVDGMEHGYHHDGWSQILPGPPE